MERAYPDIRPFLVPIAKQPLEPTFCKMTKRGSQEEGNGLELLSFYSLLTFGTIGSFGTNPVL